MDSFRWPSSGAVSSPVSAPLVVVPALALVDTPRTLHVTCTLHTRGRSGARRLRRLTPSRPRLLALALRARLARCLPLPQRALRACRVARRRAGDAATRCARGGPRRHLPCHGVARLHPHSTKACECRASRKESASKRGTAASADRLRACLTAALAALVAASGSSGCARPITCANCRGSW